MICLMKFQFLYSFWWYLILKSIIFNKFHCFAIKKEIIFFLNNRGRTVIYDFWRIGQKGILYCNQFYKAHYKFMLSTMNKLIEYSESFYVAKFNLTFQCCCSKISTYMTYSNFNEFRFYLFLNWLNTY